MEKQVAYNLDCMVYMRSLPDKAFDLAVVDPPYGGGGKASTAKSASAGVFLGTGRVARTGGSWAAKYGKKSLPGTTRKRLKCYWRWKFE